MITATAEYDIFQLVKMGESEKMIKRYVEKTLKLTYSEIEDIFGDVFERGYNRDSNLYKAVGAGFVAYKDNKQLQQFIGAIKDQTKGTYKNITNTMGFVRQREGVKTWVPLTKYYKDTLSRAVFEITIEHSLQYKYRKGIPEDIRAKLKNAADATVALDREMSYVRGEIMDAQNSFNIKANIVSEIIVNIQNLYKVGNPREIQKIQDEFYSIYKKDDMELLENFAKQLDIIAEGYKAQSVR